MEEGEREKKKKSFFKASTTCSAPRFDLIEFIRRVKKSKDDVLTVVGKENHFQSPRNNLSGVFES